MEGHFWELQFLNGRILLTPFKVWSSIVWAAKKTPFPTWSKFPIFDEILKNVFFAEFRVSFSRSPHGRHFSQNTGFNAFFNAFGTFVHAQ